MASLHVVPLAPKVSVELSQIRHKGIPLKELLHYHRSLRLPTLRATTRVKFRRFYALVAGLPEYPSPPELSHLWAGLRARGMADSTIDLLQRQMHAVFAWGNKTAHIQGNPCAFVDRKRIVWRPRSIPQLASIWEGLCSVVSSVRTHGEPWGIRGKAFLGVLRYQGLRRGEALALTHAKVQAPWRPPPLKAKPAPRAPSKKPQSVAWDGQRWERETMGAIGQVALQPTLDRGRWTIRVDGQREQPNSWAVGPLKTDQCARILEVAPPLVPWLDEVLSLPRATVFVGRGGREAVESDFLFPFRTQDLAAMVMAMRDAYPRHFEGVPAPWHAFRHTFAEDLSSAGLRVEDIQQQLGHTSPTTTEIYLRGLQGVRVRPGVLDGVWS